MPMQGDWDDGDAAESFIVPLFIQWPRNYPTRSRDTVECLQLLNGSIAYAHVSTIDSRLRFIPVDKTMVCQHPSC